MKQGGKTPTAISGLTVRHNIYFKRMVKYIFLIIGFYVLTISSSLKADTIQNDSSLVKTKSTEKTDTNLNFENESNPERVKDTLIVSVAELSQSYPNEKDNFKYIFPIITLILGIILNRGYDYTLNRIKIRKDGERWIAELTCLEKPIQNQNSSINDFLEIHVVDKFQNNNLAIHNILNCEIFKSLDKSNLLKYLKRKKNNFSQAIDLSNNIHGVISAISYVFNNMTEKFNEYIKSTTTHFDEFNRNLQALAKSFAEYGVQIEKRTGKDPIEEEPYKQIISLYSEYILPHFNDGKIEIFGLQNDFFLPLVEILAQNRLNEELNDIRLYTANCNNEIKAIKMEKRYLQENLNDTVSLFEKSKDSLIDLIEKLK